MNIALLGIDEETLELTRALLVTGEHALTVVSGSDKFVEAAQKLAPHASQLEWESLLLEDVVDVVIVGRADTPPLRAEQLKKLAQAKVPLVALHPACEAIVGYEIEMIRSDVGGKIAPYFTGSGSQPIQQLAVLASTNDQLGQVEQLVFERQLAERTKNNVLTQLARDGSLIRQILGPIKSVSAIGPLDDTHGPVTLSVQMISQRGQIARWSLEPARDTASGTITLVGSSARALLTMPQAAPWELTIGDQQTSFDQLEAAHVLSNVFHDSSHTLQLPSWVEACRATEIADTIPRCLARGKTIDLYNEEHTEEGAFKGVMAVGGCLIMMIGLLVTFAVAIMEGTQLPLYQFSLWNHWPYYLCGIFMFFLLLQLFRFAARGPRST